MKTFNVKVLFSENGKERVEIFSLDVRGKDLDEATIERRLRNNIKSLQSIWRHNVDPTIKLEMLSYEARY